MQQETYMLVVDGWLHRDGVARFAEVVKRDLPPEAGLEVRTGRSPEPVDVQYCPKHDGIANGGAAFCDRHPQPSGGTEHCPPMQVLYYLPGDDS